MNGAEAPTNEGKIGSKGNATSRRVAIVASGVILVAGGVLGSLLYLQRQPATAQQPKPVYYSLWTEEKAKERLERGKLLREKWRTWAWKHKDLLQAMLSAEADDEAALMKVWNAIPTFPKAEDSGLSEADLWTTEDILAHRLVFGWIGTGRVSVRLSDDPKVRQRQLGREDRRLKRFREDFAALRDLVIANAIAQGGPEFYLWASGRITERRMMDNPDPGPGKPMSITGPYEEVMPPYDFLKGTQAKENKGDARDEQKTDADHDPKS